MTDQSWEVREYPAYALKQLEGLVQETTEARTALEDLDRRVANYDGSPVPEVILGWARKASGHGNYLRRISGELSARLKNEEATRYIEIKMDCDKNGIKFISNAAEQDASRFVRHVRKARNIIEAYVVSADNIISICRMHLAQSNLMREAEVR
jgi:hypothetical protein